jgi:hypothetical protein
MDDRFTYAMKFDYNSRPAEIKAIRRDLGSIGQHIMEGYDIFSMADLIKMQRLYPPYDKLGEKR